jgi:hypothetical protein
MHAYQYTRQLLNDYLDFHQFDFVILDFNNGCVYAGILRKVWENKNLSSTTFPKTFNL